MGSAFSWRTCERCEKDMWGCPSNLKYHSECRPCTLCGSAVVDPTDIRFKIDQTPGIVCFLVPYTCSCFTSLPDTEKSIALTVFVRDGILMNRFGVYYQEADLKRFLDSQGPLFLHDRIRFHLLQCSGAGAYPRDRALVEEMYERQKGQNKKRAI